MRIEGKRIRSLSHYLTGLNEGDSFYVSLSDLSDVNKMQRAGFTPQLDIGEQVLPSIMGSITNYNSNGKELVHRDRSKELVIRTAYILDWHHNPHLVSIPYLRFPRTHLPAPSTELVVVEGFNGQKIIRSPELIKGRTDDSLIIHIINLFLELFGVCDTINGNLLPVFNVPITRLNWDILPPGRYPWKILKDRIYQDINRLGSNNRRLIERKLEIVANHIPDSVAVGMAGFKGYFVFGFSSKNLFILESTKIDNATYVFGQNWQALSQLSKDQILSENLHTYRFIHNDNWEDQINAILNNSQ